MQRNAHRVEEAVAREHQRRARALTVRSRRRARRHETDRSRRRRGTARSRIAPAAITPGTARTLSSICAIRRAHLGAARVARRRDGVVHRRRDDRGANPRSTCSSLTKLRVISPAPTTRIIASATSVTTSAPRSPPRADACCRAHPRAANAAAPATTRESPERDRRSPP